MNTAQERINSHLREDGIHYTFADLQDRWEQAYDEAVEYGDRSATIKIPSGSEFSAGIETVREALGR